jgi:hypothetical protein
MALLAAVLSSCSGDSSVLEDGGERVPDDAGVATDVTLDRIQIDGDRAYRMHEAVESFATRSHHITPLLSWEGKYVHVGLDGDEARWIAGIGLVSGKPPRVSYSGVFESFDESSRQATFEDGTVLEFADSVSPPRRGREVVVEIDVDRDYVVRLLN